jgi:hypothetical protein
MSRVSWSPAGRVWGSFFFKSAANPDPRCAETVSPPFQTIVAPAFGPAATWTVTLVGLWNV